MKEVNMKQPIDVKPIPKIEKDEENLSTNTIEIKSKGIELKKGDKSLQISPKEIQIKKDEIYLKAREIQLEKKDRAIQISPNEIFLKPLETINSLGNTSVNILENVKKVNKATEETISEIVKSIVKNNNLIVNETIKSLNNNVMCSSKAAFDVFNESIVDTKNTVKTVVNGVKEVVELGIDVHKIFFDTLFKNVPKFDFKRKKKDDESKLVSIDIK